MSTPPTSRVPSEARGVFPVKMAARLSGVPADSLRMWERRYGFPCPARDRRGVRRYSLADIERLTLIARALDTGRRVGDVIGLSTPALARALEIPEAPGTSPGADDPVERLLALSLRENPLELVTALRTAALTLGPRRFVLEVADPLVTAVGRAWERGHLHTHHEHRITQALTSQLCVLSATQEAPSGAPRVLLATLPGERHGLGLSMCEVFFGTAGLLPVSLGVDVPIEETAAAARSFAVAAVALSVPAQSDVRLLGAQLRRLAALLSGSVPLWVGGGAAKALSPRLPVERVATWSEAERRAERLRSRVELAIR